MSSWLRGAIDKVKEKGVKVATKTREVRSRFLGAGTADELQAQLEFKAVSIDSVEDLHETLRLWLSQMDAAGHKYSDGDRYLTFEQVFLKSHAIEEVLKTMHKFEEICNAWPLFKESPDVNFSSLSLATAQYCYDLLVRTITGPNEVWSELVEVILCSGEENATHALSLLQSLKRNWYLDVLEVERSDLGMAVDGKKSDLLVARDKIQESSDLVNLYESIRCNLLDCTSVQAQQYKERTALFQSHSDELDRMREALKRKKAASVENRTLSLGRVDKIESDAQAELSVVAENRTAIDEKIQTLEAERVRLRLELERVSCEIAAAQSEQRENMALEEKVRDKKFEEISKLQARLAADAQTEDVLSETERDNLRIVRCIAAIQQSLEGMHANETNQLADVHTQFDNMFVEAVQEHVGVFSDAIEEVYRRLKRTSDDLDACGVKSQSVSQVISTHANEHEEFNASAERANLRSRQLKAKLSEEQIHVASFQASFGDFYSRFEPRFNNNRLLKGEVDKVTVVLGECKKIFKRHMNNPAVPIVPESALVEEDLPDLSGKATADAIQTPNAIF